MAPTTTEGQDGKGGQATPLTCVTAEGRCFRQHRPVHQRQIGDRNARPPTGPGHEASTAGLRTPTNLSRDFKGLGPRVESLLKPPEEMKVKTISKIPGWQAKDIASGDDGTLGSWGTVPLGRQGMGIWGQSLVHFSAHR